MKNKLTTFAILLLLSTIGKAQFTQIGIQAGYGNAPSQPGFGLSSMYQVNDEIQLTPNFMYYLPSKINTGAGERIYRYWSINLDGTYVILNEGDLKGYGLMGLAFTNITGERDETILGQRFEDKNSMLKLGLNVGAGVRYQAGNKVTPFAEIRYTLSDKADFTWDKVNAGQFVIQAGLLIRINEDKEESTEDF